jgi:Subtilase family
MTVLRERRRSWLDSMAAGQGRGGRDVTGLRCCVVGAQDCRSLRPSSAEEVDVAPQHEQPRQPDPSVNEEYVPRVVVKFHDSVALPYDDHAQEHIARRFPGDWKRLVERFPDIWVSRLFESLTADKLRTLMERANKRYKLANSLTFFAVDCPAGTDPELVARALTTWESVEEAYVQSPPTEPPNDPFTQRQGHLGPAPQAIDALYAWQVPGGDGRNVRVADIEQGWTLNHENFLQASSASIPLNGHNRAYFDHGTNVLGVVAAPRNGVGGQGIAHRAQLMAISEWRTPSATVPDIADAIMYAAANLRRGDILLIEAQVQVKVHGRSSATVQAPVEVESLNFHAIQMAIGKGISVVEAAGNGYSNLQDLVHPIKKRVLDTSSPQFRDSGAIMVGAGISTNPHQAYSTSNFGERIDCFAWGENVYTATTDQSGSSTTRYTSIFGGTSAAAAMIAGAAASVQGMARASSTARALDPERLRALLRDPAFGTRAVPSAQIGVMPNLKAIAQRVRR